MRKYRLSIQRMMMTVLMLMMISMGAWADVDIQIAYGGFFRGGTITAKQDEAKDGKVTVSLTVTPKKGYTISKKDIIVVTTYDLPSSDEISSSRADVPKISDPIDLGDDPKDLSAERTYKVTIDENFGLWVQKATFISGRKGEGDVEVTYHIINLGRMNNDGTLGSDRTEALKFTIADNELGVPAKYKSPLATNWKYYKADEVSYNSETKVCTFNSEPTLSEGNTLSESTDIYVTYELNKDAFGTVRLKDGGIYNIKQGSLYMYQSMYQNVNNLNTYFKSTDDPTESIYLWKFNIKDPYQVTIQTKSTSYDNYYLAGEDNNFNNIRLKSSLAIAKSTKVWTFGLLPGGTDGTYRLVVADGYVPTANIQTLDAFNHGYLNNADKARYQRYQGSTYKNCDLTFPPLKRSYTFHMIDRSQRHAIQHTVDEQEVGKLSEYTDIPSAIRSPYLEGETMTFYSFTGDYSSEKITDANLVTEMPLTDADIYVTYTNTHLSDKFLHLRGARALNVKIGGQYIYDESGLKSESTDANKSQSNRLWYFTGEDPYAVHIRNAGTNNFLGYTPPSTLLVEANPANKNFILLSGGAEGDNSTYDQMELMAANGDDTYYRVGFSDGLNISTTTTGVASVQVVTYPVDVSSRYYLIDRAGKLIAGPLPSSSSELALPSEWVSPLVSKYHYYKAATENSGIYIIDAADEISNPIESESGNIYVTYDVSDVIDITGGKTYLLKFSNGEVFNQEDGKDGIITTPTKAIYPYNNGDFHLYVYGQNQWDTQLANGASTRSRWLWKIVSTGENADPYHVVIKSNQNQSVKDKKDGVDYNFPGNTYLRTYKPAGYGLVVTGVAYENEEYRTDYPGKMPTSMVNGQPTEYMILGTSLSEMTLKTFNAVDDGDDDPTNDVRQIVNCFEQYWKNNPTARDILNAADKGVGSQSVDYELSDPQKALLTAKGWHTYQAWAYSAPWNDESTGGKTLANGNHWFQTISMGDGKFTLEAVDLQPQVILLDQHGWEIMRVPMTETEILRKYDSPMVDEYHWYPTAVKTTGYHKYTISDPAPLIDIYTFGDDPATSEHKDVWYVGVSVSYSSNSLAETPETYLSGYSDQDNKYKTDFYVTYTVKSEYANAYTGAASADATIPSAYHLKQGGNYAKVDGTTLTNAEAPADMENVPNNMLWYVKPNFDIDKEMGYKYAGETGAQGNALSKSATDAANYSEGRNGFDPYNVQIQSKAQSLYYFTANTSGSKLEGGAWQGSSNQVSLKNLNVKQTATGYDQTTLNITNATFMVVGDVNGNMRLMPRFDQQKVMQGFATFEVQAAAQSVDDNGTHAQSLYLGRISSAKEISSSADITEMNGHYLLAENFTFDSNFESLENFTGIIDGQLHVIRGTLNKPLIATANGAIIRNVILESVNISSGNTEGDAGAIACKASGSTRIYNCGILSGSVGGTGDAGGIVGSLEGTSRVINCYSYATITGGSNVGGIVGNNKGTTTAASINTMVMNCMFYGDITGGTTVSPVYGGNNIANLQGGLNTFNYYAYDELKTKAISDGKYNSALAVEEKFLNRFEFYRLLLNSNKKLAAFYVTGDATDADQMAKWVLETADMTIDNPKPYPVLKTHGFYPSIINPDIENAPDSESVGRNKGGKLGKTLSVTISGTKTNGGQTWPTGASITTSSLTLQRTDKDFDRFNYNYDKVQLPYYNDVGTGNYTGGKVVTGWKITAITEITGDPYTSADYPTSGITDYPKHNYADRKSSNKDLYTVSMRIFSQGAYFDVPYDVTSITIEPYWGNAIYVTDPNYDVVYKKDYTGKQDVTQTGTQAVDNTTEFNGQKIRTSITGLGSGTTVYDNAVVLVGNFHLDGVPSNGTTPFTMMSVDEDNDHEPDYSLIYHHKGRLNICPIRFDFLDVIGTAQAQKPNGANLICNMTICKTRGWFEITNSALLYFSQFEYENLGSSNGSDNKNKVDAPLILQGGLIDQFVSTQNSKVNGKVYYIHVGGNVMINSFGLGTHSDGGESTPHVPVSVTGGEYPGFYLTGTYKADATERTDNAECYISGGYFHEAAGASLEGINGNVRWQIYNADIDNFFGGGINDAKPIKGDVTVDIYNSNVTLFCGGPKFGNMQSGKKVTTTAEGCTFGTYFGAGYGGLSYSKKKYFDADTYTWSTLQGYYTNDRGKYYDGATTDAVQSKYGKKGPGVATDFDYEFFVWSSGATGVRFFVKFASFSLAQCNDVESKLKNCTIENNYYGGGSFGKVVGTITSELDGCTVKGNVFGAGFSAPSLTLEVRNAGFTKNPNYNSASGMFEPGVFSGTTTFQWETGDFPQDGKADPNFSSGKVTTDVNLNMSNLGSVSGAVELTIKGNSVIGTEGDTTTGHVYGGGDESYVSNTETPANASTTVNIMDNTIVYGNVFGGGNEGEVSGTAKVNIMYEEE